MTDHPNHVPADALTPLEQQMVAARAARAHHLLDAVWEQRRLVTYAATVDAALEAWQDFGTGDPAPHEVIAEVMLRVIPLLSERTAVNIAAEQFGEHDADVRLSRGRRVEWRADSEQLSATYRLDDGGLVTLPYGGRTIPNALARLGA